MPTLRLPYPPSPKNVPEGITDYSESYRSRERMLLVGLILFLLMYISLVLLFAALGAAVLFAVEGNLIVRIVIAAFLFLMFLFLVKGIFRRSDPQEKTGRIRIYQEDQPLLFAFIHRVCDEVQAPRPRAVFISHGVEAAAMLRLSVVNLFKEPEKDLLVGLGLVNFCTLSEFKAVIAHEFGHFSQSFKSSSYSYVASRIMLDMVCGEDWFDRLLRGLRDSGELGVGIAAVPSAFVWVMRKGLGLLLHSITLQQLAVSREQEYHADLVAASIAGSNALTHCLLKVDLAQTCMMVASHELSEAADHKLYSDDLFLHLERTAAFVRRKMKDPTFGIPPELKTPSAGRNVRVFQKYREWEEQRKAEGLADAEEHMWSTHPPCPDREDNVKEQFISAPADNRFAWVLICEPRELRARCTAKFYRYDLGRKKAVNPVGAAKVQQFIDDERAETTYDPRYEGIYDNRGLDPGDMNELLQQIHERPWNDDRLEKVYEHLYHDAAAKVAEWSTLNDEVFAIESDLGGGAGRKARRILEKACTNRDQAWEWVQSFDRRVCLVHIQMAARVNEKWRSELVERYRFEAVVRRFFLDSLFHQHRALAFGRALFDVGDANSDLFVESMQVFREAWRALKSILADAEVVNFPVMKNFTESDRLADFILDEKLVSELPLASVNSKWINKLLNQLEKVKQRCTRLHFKSLGGILALQEKIADAWKSHREPLDAELLEEIPAASAYEVVDAELDLDQMSQESG